MQAHPWDSLAEEMTVGAKVKGRIVNVADYGAFLEIMPGVEGLIHVSEMSWSQPVSYTHLDVYKRQSSVSCLMPKDILRS